MALIHASHECESVEEQHFGRPCLVEKCQRCGTTDIVRLYGPCPASTTPDPTDTPLGQEDDWAGTMEAHL